MAAGFKPRAGVAYTALWFNAHGLERALGFRDRLTITGSISLSASDAFIAEESATAAMRRTSRRCASDDDRAAPSERHPRHAHRRAWRRSAATIRATSRPPGGADGRRWFYHRRRGRRSRSRIFRSPTRWAGPHRSASSVWSATSATAGRICRSRLHLHDTRGLAVANALPACAWAWRASTRRSAASAAARSPGRRVPRAISAPKSSRCCARRWASRRVSIIDALIEVGRLAESDRRPCAAERVDPGGQPGCISPQGGLMSANTAGWAEGSRVQPHGDGADRGTDLADLGATCQDRAGADRRPRPAAPGWVRRRFFRRVQSQQAQPGAGPEAAEGQAALHRLVATPTCDRELRSRHDGAARLRLRRSWRR